MKQSILRYTLVAVAIFSLAITVSARKVQPAPGIKNAFDYGFRPGNSAEANTRALQAALDGGGNVQVMVPGTYDLCRTILLDSDTRLDFGVGVYLRKAVDKDGNNASYVFMNRGAADGTWNENIVIHDLNLSCNGLEVKTQHPVFGMNGHLAFLHVRNLEIDGFTMMDGTSRTYVIHVVGFEGVRISRVHIEGMKDAIHFSNGRKFVIRDCIFKTYDDPLAFNAHDYLDYLPEYGWIEDGVVENCYDLADPENGTTGFFCRILAGAWRDWESGMEFQRGDTVVSDGRIYRVLGPADKKIYTSTVQPTFAQGEQTLPDGVTWKMLQDHGIVYGVGCRNIHFKDIFLQKPRKIAFQIHFDKDQYSRSYYPDSAPPVQENMVFENIFIQAPIQQLVKAKTPINNFKLINSMLNGSEIFLYDMGEGLHYDTTHVLMMGTTFAGDGHNNIVRASPTRPVDVKIIGSVIEGKDFSAAVRNVKVLESDIKLEETTSEHEPL